MCLAGGVEEGEDNDRGKALRLTMTIGWHVLERRSDDYGLGGYRSSGQT
jgi:hypothetical protein